MSDLTHFDYQSLVEFENQLDAFMKNISQSKGYTLTATANEWFCMQTAKNII